MIINDIAHAIKKRNKDLLNDKSVSSKDYIRARVELKAIAEALANIFDKTYPAFNRIAFLRKCGVMSNYTRRIS